MSNGIFRWMRCEVMHYLRQLLQLRLVPYTKVRDNKHFVTTTEHCLTRHVVIGKNHVVCIDGKLYYN